MAAIHLMYSNLNESLPESARPMQMRQPAATMTQSSVSVCEVVHFAVIDRLRPKRTNGLGFGGGGGSSISLE